MDYLKNMTVKELREIATRMNIPGRSGLAKPALVSLIANVILSDWDNAISLNAPEYDTEAEYIVPGTDVVIRGIHAELMIRHEARVRRYNPTMKRRNDNKVILTAKQRRRVQKKMKTDWKRTVGAF